MGNALAFGLVFVAEAGLFLVAAVMAAWIIEARQDSRVPVMVAGE